MVLVKRFSRLLRADMHAVLDRLEDPEVLLRQSLREMGEALEDDRRHQLKIERAIARVRVRREQLNGQVEKLALEIDRCFASEREDLLRTLLRRRLENDGLEKSLFSQMQSLVGERDELQSQIEDRSQRLGALRRRAELLETAEAELAADLHQPGNIQIREEDVELALLQERQRRAVQ